MSTLEYRQQVEQVTSKSVSEVIADVSHLKDLHAGQREARRKTRDLLNGGPAAIDVLLGASYKGEVPPVNNLIYSGLTRLAQKIGHVPDLSIPPTRDKQTDRIRAEEREDYVRGYDELCQLDMMMGQLGRWVPGYGFSPVVITDGKDWQGNPYPLAELRDPYDAYPSSWGVSQEPDRIAFIRRVSIDKLKKMYPGASKALNRMQGGGAVVLHSDHGNFEGHRNDSRSVEIAEYIDCNGTWIVGPDIGLLFEFTPNPIFPLVPFRVAKRFSFDKLVGQYDHVIGLMIANAKMNLYVLHEMQRNVTSPLVIAGQLSRGDQWFEDGINFLEPGSSAQYLSSPVNPQLFQEIDRIERQLRVTAGYPVMDDGAAPFSRASGRGIDAIGAGIENEVEEYKRINRRLVEGVDMLRLAWDEKAYPNVRKPIYGYHNDETGAPFYTPAKDIKGRWRTRRRYGMLSGLDDPSRVVQLLQLFQAGIIDSLTFQENVQGIDNIPEVNQRLEGNAAKTALRDALLAAAQGQDPKAVMALIEMLPDDKMKSVLKKFYTPEGDEMSPEEQAMAAPPESSAPQSSQTILSRLLGSGEAQTGAQVVGSLG